MEIITGELVDLQQHYMITMKDREETLEDFKKTLAFLQESHDNIVKDKDDNYMKVLMEKIVAENKVKLMENSYQQVVQEKKKIQ